jgi:CBS domain-containing protein
VSTVSDILQAKGGEVLEIEASATVYEALERMVAANVGSLLVVEGGRLRGIVTERDYLRRVALEGRTERGTTVGEIMSSPLVYVTPETTVEECMAVMTERRIRHLPVLDAAHAVVGVVSIGDVVKFQSQQQSAEIRLLTDYITAR